MRRAKNQKKNEKKNQKKNEKLLGYRRDLKDYLLAEASTVSGLTNFIPTNDGKLSVVGYRNFFGLILCLIKTNYGCRRNGINVHYNFTMPISWL